jgi:hypothetical protein
MNFALAKAVGRLVAVLWKSCHEIGDALQIPNHPAMRGRPHSRPLSARLASFKRLIEKGDLSRA